MRKGGGEAYSAVKFLAAVNLVPASVFANGHVQYYVCYVVDNANMPQDPEVSCCSSAEVFFVFCLLLLFCRSA